MSESVGVVELEQALEEKFGYPKFRPGQLEVIGHLMAGRSAAAVFATGAGKSLCYQLPATLFEGLTVVVSPLIALMKDQINALEARGIEAYKLDSTLSFEEYKTVMDRVRSGSAKMLYVAPERFNNERFRESLDGVQISLFAIDEAHCISEWGHNFRPDYLKLARFARELGAERILALTATATDSVLSDICKSLVIDDECAIRTPFYRSNLVVETTVVSARDRDALLVSRFRERPSGSAIVYVTLQKTAEYVAEMLAAAGLQARPYHAGMDNELPDRNARLVYQLEQRGSSSRQSRSEWASTKPTSVTSTTTTFPRASRTTHRKSAARVATAANRSVRCSRVPMTWLSLRTSSTATRRTRDAIAGLLEHLFPA